MFHETALIIKEKPLLTKITDVPPSSTGQGPILRAVYSCLPDHDLIGSEERLCQAQASSKGQESRWSGADPYCKFRGTKYYTWLLPG